MFIRLLIFTILGIVIYRAVKTWMVGGGQGHRQDAPPERVDDMMVKDPECGAYFAQRKGVALTTTSSEVLYFCSNECRERYAAKHNRS